MRRNCIHRAEAFSPHQILAAPALLPASLLVGANIPLLLPVVADIIKICLSRGEQAGQAADHDPKLLFRRYLEAAMKRPESKVHEAAASTAASVSQIFDCLQDCKG